MLATLADLNAIGAIPDGTVVSGKYGMRATRLIELASGQVCAYLRTTEVLLLASLTAEQVTALAAIVAECAGERLNVTAAPSTNPYASSYGYSSIMLNKWQKSQIDQLIKKAGAGSSSDVVIRDAESSAVVYLTTALGYPLDEIGTLYDGYSFGTSY